MGDNIFHLENFEEVNFELINVKYYNIPLDKKSLNVEFNFSPKYKTDSCIEIFFHIRYKVNTEEEINQSILHADFISRFMFDDNNLFKKEENEILFEIEPFTAILAITISMARGYLICRTQGNPIADFFMPVLDAESFIKASPYYRDTHVKLES